jgi:type I restriction enzyme R subunit
LFHLQRLANRRNDKKSLRLIEIDDRISERYYQKEAIRAVCEYLESGHRKALLVMTTGTGKTLLISLLISSISRNASILVM